MSNDNTVRTYYPGLNSSKVISIDSYKHDAQFNPLYNSLEISNEELSRVAEIVSNNANRSFIQGDAFSMDENNYVTHRELDEKFGRISDQIDSSEKYLKEHIERKSAETNEKIAETNGKIDVLTQSINDFKQSFPQTVNLAVRDEFDKRDKERKETNRFIIGTLVIGGISLIVSIASVIVSIFIH